MTLADGKVISAALMLLAILDIIATTQSAATKVITAHGDDASSASLLAC